MNFKRAFKSKPILIKEISSFSILVIYIAMSVSELISAIVNVFVCKGNKKKISQVELKNRMSNMTINSKR